MSGLPWISLITWVPVIGGLLALLSGRRALARPVGFAASLLSLGLSLFLWSQFNANSGTLQFVERHVWIPSLAVDYYVGVDGLGLLMVLLSTLVVPLALLVAWRIEDRPHLYFALVLFLEAGLIGTFTALNFFHWFLFWELSLIPAFFLIRFWGGPQRSAAATQFFVYTMAGSVALLLGFVALYLATGTFDFIRLADLAQSKRAAGGLFAEVAWPNWSGQQIAMLVFCGVLLGFAVKVPLIPLHTWLPAAYAEAPSGTTMLLTGLMSKMGVYGFLRVLLPIFPEQTRAALPLLLWLAVATIVFSAAAAFAQRDLKRIFAYSSINHLGYCLLGLFAATKAATGTGAAGADKVAALHGVLLQMFNHGLTAATLFAFIAFLERRSQGLRGLDDFGGLRKVVPVFCGLMGIALFSSLGLPGLNGFVGEFLIFKGVFGLASWAAALSTLGLLITAVFILTTLQRVFSGPLNQQWTTMADLSLAERAVLTPAIGLMFLLGIYPQVLIGLFNQTVVRWVEQFHL